MTNTSHTQHGDRHRAPVESQLPVRGPEDSLATLQTAYSWARRFHDPQDVTWWVHLVRPGVEQDITQCGSAQAVVLRFHSEGEARLLEPIPPDWFECDELTLWRYCEQAVLQRQ